VATQAVRRKSYTALLFRRCLSSQWAQSARFQAVAYRTGTWLQGQLQIGQGLRRNDGL